MWKPDLYPKTRRCVLSRDCALMQLDRAHRDREAKPNSAALRIPSVLDAEERLEYLGQQILGNAGATIANFDSRAMIAFGQSDLNRRANRRIANRVAQHVPHGAPQQFAISPKLSLQFTPPAKAASAEFRVKPFFAYDGLHNIIEIDYGKLARLWIALRSRNLDEFRDHRRNPVHVALNAVESLAAVGCGPGQPHRKLESRKRGPQLMRNVRQKPPFAVSSRCNRSAV